MRRSSVVLILLLCAVNTNAETINKIAFGSCLHQDKPQFIWNSIQKQKPDLFIFLGDNIYADTARSDVMLAKYRRLASQKEFRDFRNRVPIYAVWDDHDYGQNDAGREYPLKTESERIFLDFYKVPNNAPARSRPGIYDSHVLGSGDKRVQLILLDTRYFRGSTISGAPNTACPKKNYLQQTDPKVSVLGKDQWYWLEQQLQIPAEIRIIVSSIQVIPDQHCWEKWANFPLERDRLLNLIQSTNANGVLFISGDRHFAEVSKYDNATYPLYEITSSGMNTKIYGKGEENKFRLTTNNFQVRNFGMIAIDWESSLLRLQLFNDKGDQFFEKEILFSKLAIN